MLEYQSPPYELESRAGADPQSVPPVPLEGLAAAMAHEIRNPLSAIRMWMYSIQESDHLHPDLRRKCRMVTDEVNRVERIVSRFLDCSRGGAPALRPVRIGDVVDRAVAVVRARSDGARVLTADRPGRMPPVLGDPDQLIELLTILLENALDAAGSDGSVTVSAEKESGPPARLIIRVTDSGPGISKQIEERLFQPFLTTKPRGNGLGLCLARVIVCRHGGTISLRPGNGGGALAEVSLPVLIHR